MVGFLSFIIGLLLGAIAGVSFMCVGFIGKYEETISKATDTINTCNSAINYLEGRLFNEE